MPFRPSVVALVLANVVPVAGVLLFDWQVLDIVMLYWAENVVIGLVNVLRMGITRGSARWIPILFFVVHYGLFCYGHLVALTTLFGGAAAMSVNEFFFAMPLHEAWKSPLWIGIAAIALSHLYSFYSNFVAAGEYRRAHPMLLMHRPYGRIVILHVAIVIGALLVELLGSPVMMLIVLVVAKTAVDLRFHLSERRRFGALA